uniref:Metallophos domain-containing protein n=1 Tax=Angiostrongylus cantonensis TaxID=6313 RepID=A0A158P657_ANGCA
TEPTTDSTRIAVYRPSPTKSSHLTTIGKIEDPVENITTFYWLPSTITSTLTSDDSWVFNDFTIVTALIDIGRGEWARYRRPLEQYHLFMENLLSLKNNMVIFTDKASYDFIHKYRKNMGEMHRTKIHLVTLGDLPLSSYLDVASKLIEEEHRSEQLWRYNWDPAMKDHPESKSAEYDVLVNSKSYFLYNASLEDPFTTEFFVWIDAGYGHGNQSVFPYNNKWKPRFPKNKISLIKLTPIHDPISRYTIDSLYRHNLSVVSGGFLAGDKRSIGQLHTLVHRKFIELTYYKKVDDDQTVLVLAINSYPRLFHITHGDWFDAFHLFSTDQKQ